MEYDVTTPEEVKDKQRTMIEIDRTYRDMLTFELRELVGKTEDRDIPLCQHAAIYAREMAQKGVIVCRVCGTSLNNNEGRYNDHLLIRNPLCTQPICTNCSENNPDEFHKNFKKGVEKCHPFTGIPPLYLDAARTLVNIQLERKKKTL